MNTVKRKRKRKPVWYLLITLAIVVALYFTFNTGKRLTEIWRLSSMKRQEEKTLDEARKKKEQLLLEKERLLNDLSYIEEIARREYGMIREGEEMFQITLPDSEETEKDNGR